MSLHRASALEDARSMRCVIGPRFSHRPISAIPLPGVCRAGADVWPALAFWLAGSAVSDGQLDGAWRLGFQGVGSAGAVRTRAGPETHRAPPWTQGADSLSPSSSRSLPACPTWLYLAFFWTKLPFEFRTGLIFICRAKKRALKLSHEAVVLQLSCRAVRSGQCREWPRAALRSQTQDNYSNSTLSSFCARSAVVIFHRFIDFFPSHS